MMTTGKMNLRGLCTWNILLTPVVMSLGFYIEIFHYLDLKTQELLEIVIE